MSCEQQPYSAIKMLKLWERVSAYVESVQSTNLFNQNVISHFRDILKRKWKYISTYSFFLRRKFEPKVSQSEPSIEPEAVELATEPELEIVSVELSTSP